ncbi:hypothetical protein STEG23_032895 [Scotinomys teguina]
MLALSVKGKELSDEELHEKFDQLWTNWIDNVSLTVPSVKEPDIDLDSENILLEYFKKEKSIVERLKVKYGEQKKKTLISIGSTSISQNPFSGITLVTTLEDTVLKKKVMRKHGCGVLNVLGPHNLIESSTISSCGFIVVNMALLEEMRHYGD